MPPVPFSAASASARGPCFFSWAASCAASAASSSSWSLKPPSSESCSTCHVRKSGVGPHCLRRGTQFAPAPHLSQPPPAAAGSVSLPSRLLHDIIIRRCSSVGALGLGGWRGGVGSGGGGWRLPNRGSLAHRRGIVLGHGQLPKAELPTVIDEGERVLLRRPHQVIAEPLGLRRACVHEGCEGGSGNRYSCTQEATEIWPPNPIRMRHTRPRCLVRVGSCKRAGGWG